MADFATFGVLNLILCCGCVKGGEWVSKSINLDDQTSSAHIIIF